MFLFCLQLKNSYLKVFKKVKTQQYKINLKYITLMNLYLPLWNTYSTHFIICFCFFFFFLLQNGIFFYLFSRNAIKKVKVWMYVEMCVCMTIKTKFICIHLSLKQITPTTMYSNTIIVHTFLDRCTNKSAKLLLR